MPTMPNWLLIALTAVLVTGAVLAVRARLMGALQRDSGAVYAVAAAIFSVYGLVLGLTLAAAWDRYRGAEETLFNEANSIRTLHRTAASLDDTDRDAVQLALLAYGHAVIDGELGQSGEAIVSEEASDALVAIYDLLPETTPPDATTLQVRWQPALGTMYAELGILARARGSRNMIAATGLPAGFWLVLIFGACVSLAAVVLIVPAARWLHLTLSLGAAAIVVSLLLLLRTLDDPYQGEQRVNLRSYTETIERLESKDPR